MLSMTRISPNQAINYYSGDNYYTKEKGIEHSNWYGKGAEALGLSGRIDEDTFKNLLNNKSPDGQSQMVEKKSVISSHKTRAGVDLTFSAPKSVTLSSLFDPRIVEAHREAVRETLDVIEKDASLYRQGKERKIERAGNLVIAQFHHDTSRKVSADQHPDPQLHDHNIAFNMVQVKGEDGELKWKALYNDAMFSNSKIYGMNYQNVLARKCRKLGYDIEKSENGTFEIKGYTRDQIEVFSKRMTQIKELNAKTKKEERAKMLGLRSKKEAVENSEALKDSWRDEMERLGIKPPSPKLNRSLTPQEESISKVISSAVKHLSERDVSFSEKQILTFAYESNIGDIPSFDVLKRGMENSPSLLKYGSDRNGANLYTTFEALKKERAILSCIESGKGIFKPLAKDKKVERVIRSKGEGREFNEGQEKAFRLLNSSTDQFVVWQGVAGAGKSYVVSDVKAICDKAKYQISVLATDSAGAEALAQGSGIDDAATVASFLARERPEGEKIPKRQLWIVDEAGKMPNDDMKNLLEKARKEKARVAFIGDTRQLSAVGAGNPFKLIIDNGVQVAYLDSHMRQKDQTLKRAIELISKNEVRAGLQSIRPYLTEYKTRSKRIEKAVESFISLSDDKRSNTLVLAGTHKDRKEILTGIRAKLKEEGKLGKSIQMRTLRSKDVTAEASKFMSFYEVGDVMVPRKDYKRLKVEKNVKYEVVGIEGKQLLLKSEEGEQLRLDPSKISQKSVFSQETQEISEGDKLIWKKNAHKQGRKNGKEIFVTKVRGSRVYVRAGCKQNEEVELRADKLQFIDHGLVSTTYSSQGKTCDNIILVGDQTVGKELIYVALSRAKYSVNVFVESFEKLVKLSEKSKANKTALELVEAGVKEGQKEENKEDQKSDFIKGLTSSFNEGMVFDGLKKMDDLIVEAKGKNARYKELAKEYTSYSSDERLEILNLATKKGERDTLTKHIRRGLIKKGEIKNVCKAHLLVPKKIDRDKGLELDSGDIVIMNKGSSITKVRKGVQYVVSSVIDGNILVKSPAGKTLSIKEDEFNGRVFTKVKASIGEGDQITSFEGFKKKEGNIFNIENSKVEIAYRDGSFGTMNLKAPLALEHNLVKSPLTNDVKYADKVLFVGDKNLGTKALGQAINKSNKSIELYLDDKSSLAQKYSWFQEKNLEKIQRVKEMKATSEDFKKKKFSEGMAKLEPNIKEHVKRSDLCRSIAKKYVEMSTEERKSVSLLATNEDMTKSLKSHVRKELYDKGELKNLTEAKFIQEKSQKMAVEVGHYYVATKSDIGLKPGVRYQVTKVQGEKISFKSDEGKEAVGFKKETTGKFYSIQKNSIAEGDSLKSIFGDTKTSWSVMEVSDGKALMVSKDGREAKLDLNKPLPVEHDVVQISTKKELERNEKVIVACDTKVSSYAVSKAVDKANQSIEVYTEDKENLKERFSWFENQQKKDFKENYAKNLMSELSAASKKVAERKIAKSKGKGLGLDI